MDTYVIVQHGNRPIDECCNYLSSIDKDGLHFSQDIGDAIVIDDSEECVFLARALTRVFCTVDVYSVMVKTVRTCEYIW